MTRSNEELVTEIQRLESEKERLTTKAETITQSVIEAVQERIKNWAPDHIKRIVISQPEVTETLGLEGVGSLKAKMQAVIDELQHSAKDAFNDDYFWPLRNINPDLDHEARVMHTLFGFLDSGRQEMPSHITNALNKAQAPVTDFLAKYGYKKMVPGQAEKLLLLDDPEFTQKVRSLLINYNRAYESRKKVAFEIEKCRAEKARNDATNLWDQV